MIKFKNINGDVFLAVGSIKRKSALNGEKSLTGTLFEGDDVLNKIDKGWSLEFDNEPYVVTYFERNDNDNTVEFDAIHKFFWDMNKSVLYSSASGSHTAKWYLDQIFNGTGYTYALNFDPSAFEKENWGMKNKLSLFNDAISGMGGEFEINGTLVSIFKNIGSDLSTIVRHGFNLSDMSLENDNTDFVTYGEGFGAYADQENQTGERLHVTYTSPLAKTFGKLHAEPIDDQRYTIKDNLLQAIKDKVDGSFAISIKLSLYDLTAAGYPYKMANVGDWLLAIDENLDFKQKIRIISVDDEFATDSTRISYTVTCGDIGVVQKYQQANASLGQKVDSAYQNAQDAKESSIQAVIAANGKNTNYYVDGVENLPTTANDGDVTFVQTGDGQAMYIYTKLPDGSFKWVKRLDPDTGEQIAAGVDLAIETAQSQAAAMDEIRASEAAVFQSEANAALSSAAAERAVFSSNATSMANSAASRASSLANSAAVYGKAQAASALSSANSALTTAKTDLTDDISVAKSEAIEAAKTADGLIHQEVTSTAASITQTISQNKSEADGKISTAQTTATQALNGLSAKVSQTDYDAKTGALDRAVGSAALTADSAALSITKYQSTADGKLNSQAAVIDANSKAIKLKVSQSDYDNKTQELSTQYGQVKTTADAVTTEVAKYKETNDKKVNTNTANITTLNNEIDSKVSQTVFDEKTGDLDGKYSETKQTVDSISNIVTELQAKANAQGQVNQLLNTEFNPDLGGWTFTNDNGTSKPYKSYIDKVIGSVSIGFNTVGDPASTYGSTVMQDVLVSAGSNGVSLSMRWDVRTVRNDYYTNLWLTFKDSTGAQLGRINKQWSYTTADNRWHEIKWENVALPDGTRTINVVFAVRENTTQYLARPMLVFGSTIGDYVPGNYNNNNRVAALELGIDHITGLVDDPSKGLSATWNLANNGQTVAVSASSMATVAQSDASNATSSASKASSAASAAQSVAAVAQTNSTTAVTTANGVQTTVKNTRDDVDILQGQQTLMANQFTIEIQDRKDGDKSVLTQTDGMIDGKIADYNRGVVSNIAAMADGIYANVSSIGVRYIRINGQGNNENNGTHFKRIFVTDKSGKNVLSGLNATAPYGGKLNNPSGGTDGDILNDNTYISLYVEPNADKYIQYDLGSIRYDLSVISLKMWTETRTYYNVTVQVSADNNSWRTLFLDDIHCSDNPFYDETIRFGAMGSQGIMSLTDSSFSTMLTNHSGNVITAINGDTSGVTITGKQLTLDGNTTVTGDFYAKGGNFKNLNASNITTGTIDAANIKVINLDVSSLSGNITNFIKSYWNAAYSNVEITGSGMTVSTSGIRTTFDSTGAHYANGSTTAQYQFVNWKDDSGNMTNALGLNYGLVGTSNSYVSLVGSGSGSVMLYANENMNYGSNSNIVRGRMNMFSPLNMRNKIEFFSNSVVQSTYIVADEKRRTLNFYTNNAYQGNGNYFWFNHNVLSEGTFNGSSLLSKKNVKSEFDTDALSEIAKTKLVNFEYKNNIGENHVSPIIDDINEEKQYYVPEKILSKDKEHVDMYSMISMAWKAIQQLDERTRK